MLLQILILRTSIIFPETDFDRCVSPLLSTILKVFEIPDILPPRN